VVCSLGLIWLPSSTHACQSSTGAVVGSELERSQPVHAIDYACPTTGLFNREDLQNDKMNRVCASFIRSMFTSILVMVILSGEMSWFYDGHGHQPQLSIVKA
jgi:hypothetical protein